MNFVCPCSQVKIFNPPSQKTTEKIKLLKVIGENRSQVLGEKCILIHASKPETGGMEKKLPHESLDLIKVDHLHAELCNLKDILFKNKVVKQGSIHVQIFYVNSCNVVMHTSIDIPFTLIVDFPGFEPSSFTEVQNHLIDITPVFLLTPARHCEPGTLEIKVVAHILTVVSEWVQRDITTAEPKTKLPLY